MDRFARVTHYSTGISMVACMIMAIVGFLTFGDKTQGNVLNNFPNDNIMVNIARLYDPTRCSLADADGTAASGLTCSQRCRSRLLSAARS